MPKWKKVRNLNHLVKLLDTVKSIRLPIGHARYAHPYRSVSTSFISSWPIRYVVNRIESEEWYYHD
jgi:hypothetical protein